MTTHHEPNVQTKSKLGRREALKLVALAGGSLALAPSLSACGDDAETLDGIAEPLSPRFAGGLTSSAPERARYEARVRGRLPRGLTGTLYKNGPGLFERAGVRKRTLLDGDGMITAYRFDGRRVTFESRFVRTPKLEAEQAAGRFLENTWTTQLDHPERAPGDQAGVTVFPWQERLYAFDESALAWQLDPRDLSTIGQTSFGLPEADAALFAHGKQLAGTGEYALFGVNYQALQYNYLVLDGAHRVVARRTFPVTSFGPPAYMHDWFVTPRYFVLHLMPALIDGDAFQQSQGVLRNALRWQPSMPSRLLVFRRDDQSAPPQIFELPASWMWHTANAFERGDGELVLDWVGYDDPFHFVGAGAEWERIMEGTIAPSGAAGVLRRSVLDLRTSRLTTSAFTDLTDQEFPVIAPAVSGRASRYVYLVHEPGDGVLYQSVAKVDLESGRSDVLDLGHGRIALEPTFVPHPQARAEDDGWLLVEVANADSGRAELWVLDARCVADGPVATVHLHHHVPMRFHGRWAQG